MCWRHCTLPASWEPVKKPFLAFHVSGGTTDSLYCEPDEQAALKINPLRHLSGLESRTGDRSGGADAGIAVSLRQGTGTACPAKPETVPDQPVIRGVDCCLSGLENQCRKKLEQGEPPADIARFCLMTVAETVIAMTKAAQERHGKLPVLYAGGVMSNQLIRPLLAANAECWFAAPEFACDNAAGVAVYGAWRKQGGKLWQF